MYCLAALVLCATVPRAVQLATQQRRRLPAAPAPVVCLTSVWSGCSGIHVRHCLLPAAPACAAVPVEDSCACARSNGLFWYLCHCNRYSASVPKRRVHVCDGLAYACTRSERG